MFDRHRAGLFVVDLRLPAANNDFGRAIFADVDAVIAFFQKSDGDNRRVYFKVNRIVVAQIVGVDDVELSPIQTIHAKRGRSDGQSKLNGSGVELGKPQIGIAVNADKVSPAKLNFGSSVWAAVKLVAFVERQIQRSVVPTLTIGKPLVTDFAFDQADARNAANLILGDSQSEK